MLSEEPALHGKGFILRVLPTGCFTLTAEDRMLIERGCLNEFFEVGVGSPSHRQDHYIQNYNSAEVEWGEGTVTAEGVITSSTHHARALRFRNRYTLQEDHLLIEVHREYLVDVVKAGDDSVCFNTPTRVPPDSDYAQWYQIESEDPIPFLTRSGKELWTPVKEPGTALRTKKPRRLATRSTGPVRASILGEGFGFRVDLLEYTPQAAGEIRITCSENAFYSEIELQFAPCGPRKAGHCQTATFHVWPITEMPNEQP